MELKYQVCNFEQAKRLKELGVNQESLFYHFQQTENDDPDVISCDIKDFFNHAIFHSAFTVAELGNMIDIEGCVFTSYRDKDKWVSEYNIEYSMDIPDLFFEWGNTEAESRAAIIIYLLEKEIIKVEDLKK